MANSLSTLEEITDVKDIKKLGLEQYTPLIVRCFCLDMAPGRRVYKEDALSLIGKEATQGNSPETRDNSSANQDSSPPTHYMFSLQRFRAGESNYAIYAFVFYGPKRKDS